MKKKYYLYFIFSLLVLQNIFPQEELKEESNFEYFSFYEGVFTSGEAKFKTIFKFYRTGDSIGAHLVNPTDLTKNIDASNVYYTDDSINIQINAIGAVYAGKFINDKNNIEGEWIQSGMSFPLNMEKVEKVEGTKFYQEPKRPFPYNEEEITFKNISADVTLAGTFTYPKEKSPDGNGFPAVVLVTGSGPQTRDEEAFGHKPFLVWSDYLTRNGIAVLRYDDRGIGKSTGDFSSATTYDFSADAEAAVNYLMSRKEINPKKIGVIGHSEGGLIAPIVANKSENVAFIILAAGPAVPGDELILLQTELIMRKMEIPEDVITKEIDNNKIVFEAIKNSKDLSEVPVKLDSLINEINKNLAENKKRNPDQLKSLMNRYLNSWFTGFIKIDPGNELTKLKIPVLAMFGENDLQVPPSPNKDEMEKALAKSNSNYKIVLIEGLNHIFQESESGLPTEYGTIEQTASPKMLELMTSWIKALF